jgi:hypothetical protein
MSQRDATSATLWIPGPLPGMNDVIDAAKGSGGRGKDYSVMKRTWSEIVWAEALRARIQRPGPFAGPVHVRFLWVERDQRRDKDNIAAAKKFVLDGLVTALVLRSDGWDGVASFSDEFAVDAARPGVHVTITMVG